MVLNWALQKAISIGVFLIERKKNHAAIDKAVDEYKEAGTAAGLTPEQKAKEQQDAFEKLADIANRKP
jgi:hypothetical protein